MWAPEEYDLGSVCYRGPTGTRTHGEYRAHEHTHHEHDLSRCVTGVRVFPRRGIIRNVELPCTQVDEPSGFCTWRPDDRAVPMWMFGRRTFHLGQRSRHSKLNNFGELARYWRSDFMANPRDPKAWMVLFGFRLCQALRTLPGGDVISLPFVAVYRILSEWILGVELRPKTQVGPGLSIYHGVGLVVNNCAVIGSGVKLRHGVTIGHARAGGPSPVIGNRVDIGAGAIILGEITIGDDAVIGAGSVVVHDVPRGATAFGNPAVVRLSREN